MKQGLDLYIPMNRLILDKETAWIFTSVNISTEDIARMRIVKWCVENLNGRWTMLGGTKFGFESGEDALIFKINFDSVIDRQ